MPWLDQLQDGLARADTRPARHAAGVVGAAAGDGADPAQRRRRSCLMRVGDLEIVDRLPGGRGARATPASRTASGSTSSASWSRPSSPQRAVDWSNALVPVVPVPCVARRPVQRVPLQLLQVAVGRTHAPRREPRRCASSTPTGGDRRRGDPLGDYMVQRTCPHRQADLSVFGEIEGDELVCTLHGWRFDLDTGECLTADDRPLPRAPRQRRRPRPERLTGCCRAPRPWCRAGSSRRPRCSPSPAR